VGERPLRQAQCKLFFPSSPRCAGEIGTSGQLSYNLPMTTETSRYIPLIIDRLKATNPAKVILFGSQARGTAMAASDLDLLVVTNDNKLPQTYREKEEIYLEVARLLRDIRGAIPMDLIVHTRPMHARFIEMNSLFARELLQKGILLYESNHS
jgi:uncharacterized protein